MKIFGSISELVSTVFRKDSQGITLRPSQAVTYTAARDVQLPPEDGNAVLVSADSTQTLTNKIISGASNTISGINLTSQVTGILPAANGGTGVANSSTLTYGSSNISLTTSGATSLTLPTAGTLATLAGAETLTNKSISGSTNTLTNVSLTAAVTGVLPLANGGTNATSKTAAMDSLSPLTTKGDLVAFDGTHNVRFAVGSDGTVLTANSGNADGLGWTTPLVNPMTTTGDLIVGGSGGSATRLAVGATGTVLHGGSTPAYSQIVNADVDPAAAIAYSKLTLTGDIVNADISTSAAIAFSKLASLTSANILVGNGSNVATAVAVTGDVTVSNAGVTAIGSSKVTSAMIVDGTIVDADINASAAIAGSKLQAASASNVGTVSYESTGTFSLVWDQNGVTHSTVTAIWYRTGKQVTLYIPDNVSASKGTGTLGSDVIGVIPTAVRPIHTTYVLIAVTSNSAILASPGVMEIDSSGSITMGSSTAEAGFSSSGTCGASYANYFTYITN